MTHHVCRKKNYTIVKKKDLSLKKGHIILFLPGAYSNGDFVASADVVKQLRRHKGQWNSELKYHFDLLPWLRGTQPQPGPAVF